MSNHQAIATVTKAFAQMLDEAVKAVVDSSAVETKRPEQDITEARLHLFLYQVTPNPALRNADLPTRNSEGAVISRPASALDLHYLLTFYGDEKKFEPQRMLGGVVRKLLSEPGLTRERILIVSKDDGDKLDQSNLANAVEQIKFTHQSLSLEELSRIWSVFYQLPYALSVGYLATVVLIESDESVQAPQPVLRRGQQDRGVETSLGPFPALDSIHIGEGDDDVSRLRQPSYPSARLGTIVTLSGRNLGGDSLIARFTHQRLKEQVPDIPVTLTPNRNNEIKLTIPNSSADETKWAAGIYTLTVVVSTAGQQRNTNSLPLAFAPQIQQTVVGPRDLDGNVTVTVTPKPQVRPAQVAALILPDAEPQAGPRALPADPLKFLVTNPAAGKVTVRLRVDGVDNLQFKLQGTPPALALDKKEITFA